MAMGTLPPASGQLAFGQPASSLPFAHGMPGQDAALSTPQVSRADQAFQERIIRAETAFCSAAPIHVRPWRFIGIPQALSALRGMAMVARRPTEQLRPGA